MGIVARQSIKGTIATYVGVAVGIITTFFIQTKALQPEQIGLIDVLLQCSILFSGLALLGTTSSAMRYYPFFKDEEQRDHGFFGWTLLVPLVGFTLFLLANVEIGANNDHQPAGEQHQITRRPANQISDYQKDGAGQNQRQSYGVIPPRE